ncbi:MAG: hypothetical protein ACXWLQ_07835, partial [Rhizomicrobium sp.]
CAKAGTVKAVDTRSVLIKAADLTAAPDGVAGITNSPLRFRFTRNLDAKHAPPALEWTQNDVFERFDDRRKLKPRARTLSHAAIP